MCIRDSGFPVETEFDKKTRSSLQGFLPLEPGKKINHKFKEDGFHSHPGHAPSSSQLPRYWNVQLEVLGVDLADISQTTIKSEPIVGQPRF